MADAVTLEDAFNTRFQDLLYALIDSKADGLRDCTVTEIVDVAATAFVEAGKDAAQDDIRQQGQGEGFAAAVQWLRDRSACRPRAPLWSAANELADAMEQSRRPGSSVRASA